MAIQLKVPTTKTFYFKIEPDETNPNGKIAEVSVDEPHDLYVTFAQATTRDVEQRPGAYSKRAFSSEGERWLMYDETNVDFIARLEVRLTLRGCDIQLPNDDYLEFDKNGVKSPQQFDSLWDILPPQWAREFHRCCLETNPNWNPKRELGGSSE